MPDTPPSASAPAWTPDPRLRADCSRCCGLCCVAPAFDAIQGFGYDKPASKPCRNLQADFRCGIHAGLAIRGFPGCASFDCYGAGQRVTHDLFGGRSWRSHPELAPAMFNAYFRYRALHELMALLELAVRTTTPTDREALLAQLRRIDALCTSGQALSESVRIPDIRSASLQLL